MLLIMVAFFIDKQKDEPLYMYLMYPIRKVP